MEALGVQLQLLWFEGKPVPVPRPQGRSEYSGHLLYRGSAPIFVTTGLDHIEEMELDVARAAVEGKRSDESMLLRRLRVYRYRVRVPMPPSHIPRCARCFAEFLFQTEAEWQLRRS